MTDLLDTAAPPTCAVDHPCPVEFQVLNNQPPTCQIAAGAKTGICSDPLAAAPVTLGGLDDGNAFRLVFSKPLDPALDTVSMNADGTLEPTLSSGIAEIDDPDGVPLPATAFYDPTGAATTYDALQAPFGPAIELDLVEALAPNTTYTIKLDTTRVVDRSRQAAVDSNGRALPSSYTLAFTTVADFNPLSVTPDITAQPDATTMTPAIAPDDVIQLLFAAPVADPMANGSTTVVTLTTAGNAVPIEVWRDQGAPKQCAGNPSQLDIVAVSAPGNPMSLAAGLYTLTVSGVVDAKYGRANPYSASFSFYVAGAPDPMDANAVSNFYVPGAGACK